ncbi:hypothetical protein O6H91_09G006200 [Diphasiastrum complanatum]|uniref:Uncharacterized protein n=1 Tax=Diphasiastrum complanatum TaxID=34168 RepID=A0ACC2CLT8_DIPCM|nr:hypothetical protein O6H91_09G006200 [Diphasiastrum complanatum]
MKVIKEKQEMRSWSRAMRKAGNRVALVPTMGFLHSGHLALVEEAKKHAQHVVVSIYVNPGQFAPNEDFGSYPRDIDGDLQKLQPFGVDAIFNPFDLYERHSRLNTSANGIAGSHDTKGFLQSDDSTLCEDDTYGQEHETWIQVEKLSKPLCGQNRPIFFRGVATVVAKLFNIVEPDVAIFGKKDFQQWRVICRMVRDLDFAVDIVGCPIARDFDGIAMSSRNVHLSPTDRCQALSISRSLREAAESVTECEVSAQLLVEHVRKAITAAGGKIDYASIVDQETLKDVREIRAPVVFAVAAWFGGVRLLDNIELQPPQSLLES